MRYSKEFIGETLRPFILVLFGCKSVAVSVLFKAYNGIMQIALVPMFIGLTITSVICLIAPLTQAGLNPTRDFGTRLVASVTGWGDAAFPDHGGGFFFVYFLSPIVGGPIAVMFFVKMIEPEMKCPPKCDCSGDESSVKRKYLIKMQLHNFRINSKVLL